MWSPAGRLFQVEYAMEAIKQGSDAISLRSRIHAVLACINKAGSKLSSHQKKIFDVDNHVGVAIFGLTTDSRVLSCYMPFQCIKHAFIYESPLSVIRLVVQFADKAQLLARRTEEIPIELPVCQMIFWHIGTQRSWKRPNGVGLLVAGLDESGAHLYYNCPSGNYFEYQAFAIRSCSQAAKTYLEHRFENFVDSSWEDLVKDALIAIRDMIFWHVGTQLSWKRPNGVGLLVAGLDESGAHLYYNCPSGNYFEYQAFAIRSHSQAAKTYLERRFENFVDSSREDLVKDALIAIRDTLQGEKLKSSICVVAEVRVGEQFHVLDQDKVQQLIIAFELVEEEEPHSAEPSPGDHAAVEGEGASSDQAAAPTEI